MHARLFICLFMFQPFFTIYSTHLANVAGTCRSLCSFLLWRELSLKLLPKKFCDLSPRLCPPYPAMGITIFTSLVSFEKIFLKPSLKLKKSSLYEILLSRILGLTLKSVKVEPIFFSVSVWGLRLRDLKCFLKANFSLAAFSGNSL